MLRAFYWALCFGATAAIVSCDSNRSTAPTVNGSGPQLGTHSQEIRNEKDVLELVEAANRQGRPLNEKEVASLEAAAKRGVLQAYYALYSYHDLDGDRSEANRWFRDGLAKGESNILALQAGVEKSEAESESRREKKIALLMLAKMHFRGALSESSRLTVSSPETVRENLADVERTLDTLGN
jgi:hypothetical protein